MELIIQLDIVKAVIWNNIFKWFGSRCEGGLKLINR